VHLRGADSTTKTGNLAEGIVPATRSNGWREAYRGARAAITLARTGHICGMRTGNKKRVRCKGSKSISSCSKGSKEVASRQWGVHAGNDGN